MSQIKQLTVIVITYDMRREAARTLYALTPRYQLGVRRADYDVHVIDSGSGKPLDPDSVGAFGDNFRYSYFEATNPSPCAAINYGVKSADTPFVMIMIDGARIPSPGMLQAALEAASLCDNPYIYTLGMHLGPKRQNESMLEGYDQGVEDKLLATVNWQQNGYRLFDVSVLGGSYRRGYSGRMSESNCFCLRRDTFIALGGYETRFASPGGGLVNLDFFNRAHGTPGITPILLLGEATFHQFHGGVATNTPVTDISRRQIMAKEYQDIRGEMIRTIWRKPLYFGRVSSESAHLFNPQPATRADTPLLLVLGMHRSGTSCLAGMLQGAGFESGVVERWSPDNRRGSRTNLRVVKLNDALLRRNRADWEHPPAELQQVDDDLRETRGEILLEMAAADRPVMFKDPRTLLTLPFWRESIPNPYRIGIFRHPVRVASSLYYRSQIPIREGLLLWLAYNRLLMAEHERVPFPVLCFDLPREHFIGSVVAALERECADLLDGELLHLDKLQEFYAAELVHQRVGNISVELMQDSGMEELLGETLVLYGRLRTLAGCSVHESAKTQPPVSGEDLGKLIDADRMSQTGDTAQALELYRVALATTADPAAIWWRISSMLQDHTRTVELGAICEEAVRACPEDGQLLLALANVKKKAGLAAEALNLVEGALAVAPEWPVLWQRKGEWLCDESRWNEAVEALQQCVRLQPTEAGFWVYTKLAEALICSGQKEPGKTNFAHALKLVPEKSQFRVYHRLAQALLAVGEIEAAIEAQQTASLTATNAPHIHVALANVLRRQGRDDEALETLKRALQRGEDAAALRVHLARIAFQLGQRDEAAAQLAAIEACEPDNAEVSKLRAAWAI